MSLNSSNLKERESEKQDHIIYGRNFQSHKHHLRKKKIEIFIRRVKKVM